MSACTSVPSRRLRPSRNVSSMMKHVPTTSAPSCSTSFLIPSTVPPVASTSSWITTRDPFGIRSGCSSSEFCPYSSAYVTLIVSGGSFPGRRAGTKPTPACIATAAPRMNPRASAPITRSQSFSCTQVASCSTVSRSASASASSGVKSLNPTPGVGKSGTSRIFVRRSVTARSLSQRRVSQVAPEEQRRQLARELGELLHVAERLLAALCVATAQRRREQLLDQRGLPAGRRAKRAQVARVDAVAHQLRACCSDVCVGLEVPLVARAPLRGEQAEVLELLRDARIDAGALAQLVGSDRLLLHAERGRTAALALLL